MKVDGSQRENINASLANSKNTQAEANNKTSDSKSSDNASTIYAGDLNLNANDADSIKQLAQKRALRTIIDQFENEKKTDKQIDKINEMKQQIFDIMHMVLQCYNCLLVFAFKVSW